MIWEYYNLFTYDKQAVFADENLLSAVACESLFSQMNNLISS